MKGSLRIGRMWGVDIYVHFTFFLVLLFWGGSELASSGSIGQALNIVAIVCGIFGCVTLHEFGHILAARRYGIGTRDVILFPIGGVARLESMPRKPMHELVVALAGPAVNAALALVLWPLVVGLRGAERSALEEMRPELLRVVSVWGGFFWNLLWANVIMGVFNLIPAFPMDGGRVLRALLSTRMDYVKATRTAAVVGQILAVTIGIAGGVYQHYLLLFTALFVWIGAAREAEDVAVRAELEKHSVNDAMVTNFQTVGPEDTAADVVRLITSGWQKDFPVVEDDAVVGLVTSHDLIRVIAEPNGSSALVSSFMRREFPQFQPGDGLDASLQELSAAELPLSPVMEKGNLVGLLTRDNLTKFLFLRPGQSGAA